MWPRTRGKVDQKKSIQSGLREVPSYNSAVVHNNFKSEYLIIELRVRHIFLKPMDMVPYLPKMNLKIMFTLLTLRYFLFSGSTKSKFLSKLYLQTIVIQCWIPPIIPTNLISVGNGDMSSNGSYSSVFNIFI